MLALDLGVLPRRAHEIQMKEPLAWCATWVKVALGCNTLIHFRRGGDMTLEFLTGCLVELSLSADNLFVFLLISTIAGQCFESARVKSPPLAAILSIPRRPDRQDASPTMVVVSRGTLKVLVNACARANAA